MSEGNEIIFEQGDEKGILLSLFDFGEGRRLKGYDNAFTGEENGIKYSFDSPEGLDNYYI